MFHHHDVLVTASGLAPASRFDVFGADWPPPRVATAMQTIPFNVTGHPALALPMGIADSGLPTGLQVVGRPFDEATVLGVAAVLEVETGHPNRRPPGF